MITNEQIIQIALKHLLPYDESGELQWWGKEEQLLKFALVMYNKGICEGAYQQSKRYMKENLPDD